MADNTTTYKAVIETEVKGGKEVEDLNDKLEDGAEKFKSLRSQIRETTVKLQEMADQGKVGTKEFKELSDQLDELGDQQKKVAFQSGQIEDKLAALPGPIGQIGKGFASAKEAVDTFGTGLAVATGGITLIIGAVLTMKEAMSKTKEGQETLNKVTEAFGKIMAPIFALFEKIGIPIFNKVAEVLGWLGDKLSKLLQMIGVTPAKINEIATQGNKAFYDAAQQDLENAKKVADLQKQQDEENKRKALERRQKFLEQQAEQQRLADEKEKRDLQYQLDQMEKMRKKFADKLGTIESDSIKLRTSLALKAEKEALQREKDFEDQIRVLKINSIDKQQAWAAKNQSTALTKEIEARTTAVKKINKVDEWLNSEKKKKLDENLQATKAALNIAGNLVDEGSDAAKAIAIAQTTIDTYQSATAAYKAVVGIPVVGPALAPVAAAAAVAAGLMSVNKILETKVPKMGDGGGGDGGASASIPVPSIPSIAAPEINVSGGTNPTSQIAQTLASASGKPIKAFVVSTDISSTQALDRRTNRAATLSGG